MRLELYKLGAEVGDIKNSRVKAPIKDYTPEHMAELQRRYDRMKSTLPVATKSAPKSTRKPETDPP